MAKKDTIEIKMLSDGRTYSIENTKYDTLERVFMYAKENMTSPCMFHLLSHIDDPELFRTTKRTLIKSFKSALKRQYKPLKQQCPDTIIAYSIEFKYTSKKEIDGDKDAYGISNHSLLRTKETLPFLHIHFYVIADCKKTIAPTFPNYAIKALDELKGLRAGRYLKSINGEIYKSLNKDCDDAFSRFLYIGKISQKSPEIPYRKAFDTSKVDKEYKAG